MRISSSMIFTQNVAQMDNLTSQLTTTQQEISSGLKDTTGQNAMISAQVLTIQQLQAANDQYTNNRTTASTSLQQVDSTLNSAANTLASIKTLAVQVQRGTLSDSDRNAIATQIKGSLSQLLTLANSTDGSGNYIFSGYQSGTVPYVENPAGSGNYTYQGDQGQRNVEVAQGQQMPISVSGSSVFGSGATSIFNQLSTLATQLSTPVSAYTGGVPPVTGSAAQYSADLTTAAGNINQALDNVTNVNTAVGNNQQQLTALNSLGSDLSLNYQQMMSTTGDVDIISAITNLNQQQNALTAAEKSFAQVSNLSLFNFMH